MPRILLLLQLFLSLAIGPFAFAQSGSRTMPQSMPQSMPKSGVADVSRPNPFLPQDSHAKPTNLACQGYCVVSLVKHGKWVPGIAQLHAVYDGQLYRFADARKQAIFAADPSRYAPALAGDCIVTYSTSQRRIPGELRHGLVHGEQLLFFADEQRLAQFKQAPEDYLDADLVLSGICPLTLLSEQREIAGTPDLEVTLDGLRYRFVNLQLRSDFLANPRPVQQALGIETGADEVDSQSMGKPTAGNRPSDKMEKPIPPTRLSSQSPVAAGGFCLVSLLTEGAWKRGLPSQEASFQGLKFRFANSRSKIVFEENPAKFAPAKLGNCIVTLRETGQQALGSVYHAAEFQGRLYFLAGEEQKQSFLATPEQYIQNTNTIKNADRLTDGDRNEKKLSNATTAGAAASRNRSGSDWQATVPRSAALRGSPAK